jgi:hypothetical protein
MSQSTGCLNTLMKMLAAFLAFIVIVALPISLLMYNVARVVLSPEIMSDLLTTHLVESGVIRGFITDSLLSPESLQEQGPGEFNFSRILKNLSPEERGAIVDILIPPEWIEDQISTSFKAAYTWIDDDRPLPLIHLDMVPIKERLLGGGVVEVVDTIVDSWPSCSPVQVENLREVVEFGGEFPEFLCEPPEPFRGRIIDLTSSQLIQMVRELPQELPLSGDQPDPRDMTDIAAMKEWIRLARALSRSIWLLPIALLGLIMALVIRSWSELGRWWGIPLLAGGVFTLMMVPLVSAGGEIFIARQLTDLRHETNAAYELLVIVFNSLRDAILGGLLFHAALVGGIGLAFLIGGWLASRRTSSEPAGRPGVGPSGMEAVATSEDISPMPPVSPPPQVSPLPEDETVKEYEG